MKKLSTILPIAMMCLAVGCAEPYDDSAIRSDIEDLQERVTALEEMCREMNSNIEALQTIVAALQNNDYVTKVEPVLDNGATIGYTIYFSKSNPVTIYHGKDGENGKDGQDGADGKDGYTPQIGVKQDTDGIYYWTLDGEWLLDENGNKIKAQGTDGKDGQDGENGADGNDGANGNDGATGPQGPQGDKGDQGETGPQGPQGEQGITPLLKIENDYWYVSYDNGQSWTQLGKATGEKGEQGEQGPQGDKGDTGAQGPQGESGANGDSFFQSVTQDERFVYFTLADGTIITLPKGTALDITFAESDLVVMSPNSTREINYTVQSVTDKVTVEVTSSADIRAKVVTSDASGKTGKIKITTGAIIDEYSKVIVFVSNGEKVIMKSITFEQAGLEISNDATLYAPAEGGNVTLTFLSNVECEVVIPEEAQEWISIAPTTRAMTERHIALQLTANEGYYRSVEVKVQSTDGKLAVAYTIEQDGDLGVYIDPTAVPDNEIWYTTIDGNPVSLLSEVIGWPDAEFNTKVVSNTYQNGIGKIKFEQSLTEIKRVSFAQKMNLATIYLPYTLNKLSGSSFVRCFELEKVFINSHSLSIISDLYTNESNPFGGCEKLSKFSGIYASEDERCLVIDNTICSFAPYGLTEYSTPQGVERIGVGAFRGHHLNVIRVQEGVTHIEPHSITGDPHAENTCLEYVYLPNSLTYVNEYAFIYNKNIKAFYGDNEFVTDDNMALVSKDINGDKWLISFASGTDLTEFSIPEGVIGIENYAFYHASSLKILHFPDSFEGLIGGAAFEGTYNINKITGKYVLDDNRSMVIDGTLVVYAGAELERYVTPKCVTRLGYQVLGHNEYIKEYILSDEISVVDSYGYTFTRCPNLETVTISANLCYLGYYPFASIWSVTPKLKTVYCRALIPPVVYYNNIDDINFTDLVIYVPEQSLQAYLDSPDWAPYKRYIQGYEYTDLPENDTYFSTDYSQDGVVTTLQTATVGNGIDIVLMGDAYSDRQIADGTYKADMENLYNNLFTEEPYKSYKEYFNVYSVNVVSATEGYENGNTALGTYFGDGTFVGGTDSAVFHYAQKAIGEERMDEAMIVVAMNSNNYAGTCWMYYPEGESDYGKGVSISYFPSGGDAETFAQILHHEANGHGFAKLADEYAYGEYGAITDFSIAEIQYQHSAWGWWKNVDFTNDPNEVLWSRFLADERYANEGLGVFEGGLTYWSGVWRPSENSIMRYNTGGFNAPSREAIYYRIHKLAYGAEWEYDYEEFVEWDAINRTAEASAPRKVTRIPMRQMEHTAPPVVVKKSWREAAN